MPDELKITICRDCIGLEADVESAVGIPDGNDRMLRGFHAGHRESRIEDE